MVSAVKHRLASTILVLYILSKRVSRRKRGTNAKHIEEKIKLEKLKQHRRLVERQTVDANHFNTDREVFGTIAR
ncbi:hypothetical protein J6590_091055 [Homalodisca vitripennis]|nr:hypothetical protein J6590_091055 [Homalodisca vitripennis]